MKHGPKYSADESASRADLRRQLDTNLWQIEYLRRLASAEGRPRMALFMAGITTAGLFVGSVALLLPSVSSRLQIPTALIPALPIFLAFISAQFFRGYYESAGSSQELRMLIERQERAVKTATDILDEPQKAKVEISSPPSSRKRKSSSNVSKDPGTV